MDDEELYQLRYQLRELSSECLALATRCDSLKMEARRLSTHMDEILWQTKPKQKRRWWQRAT